ncbi:MAG TPA: undecaprenyl-phosphate glucose phosphotransferase [Candidatus Dojkabacteria bacterium]|nr:undecaprenyl-phosphate glucose phosphotransferase [Candidatus Dojkabacteria bacterium]
MGLSFQIKNRHLLFDLIIIILSFIIAELLSPPHEIEIFTSEYFILLLILMVIWVFYSRSSGLYRDFISAKLRSELILLSKNILVQFFSGILALFFIKNILLSRRFIIYYSLILVFLLITERLLIRYYLKNIRKIGENPRRIIIIGAGKVGQTLYNLIKSDLYSVNTMIGFLDDKPQPVLGKAYLGNLDSLYSLLEQGKADEVYIALPTRATQKIENIIDICRIFPVQIHLIPDYFKYTSHPLSYTLLGNLPVVNLRYNNINEFPFTFYKRLFDIIFSSLMIVVVLSWLIPLIGLLIKISSPGPIFFIQERWGRGNRKFKVLKFRTMVPESKDVDHNGDYNQAKKDDPRITKIGNFLRKTNLDEFPQFINVFLGDMSVVGPRPHPTPLNIDSKNKIENYLVRHLVKPGLTGWAQVNGFRGETETIEKMKKRVEYDLWYIENWTFGLDIQIIFLTIWQMLKGDKNAY